MKRIVLSMAVSLVLGWAGTAAAQCVPGTSWTASWTDEFGETTYTIQAPCKVFIGIPFDIVARVVDAANPNADVAARWSIIDNGSLAAGGGFNWITTSSGVWQTVLRTTYTGLPVDHTIEFQFTDLGSGTTAHFWGASLIGGLTVDPFPPSANAPPAVDAGPDLVLASTDVPGAEVGGSASDADGDSLSYRWLEDGAEIQSAQPVGATGGAPLYLDGLLPLSLGVHVFTLEVTGGADVVTDSVTVSVENSAPVASPFARGTVRIWEPISLAGTVADMDGDVLSWRWHEGTAILAEGNVAATAGGAPVSLPTQEIPRSRLGTHELTLTVSDGIHTVSSSVFVTVTTPAPPRRFPPGRRTFPRGTMER